MRLISVLNIPPVLLVVPAVAGPEGIVVQDGGLEAGVVCDAVQLPVMLGQQPRNLVDLLAAPALFQSRHCHTESSAKAP